MPLGELRCRLRIGKRIVGYERDVEGSAFYSKDMLWWTGMAIAHDERDAYLGVRDKNDRPLFDGDVVRAVWRGENEERRLHLRLTGAWLEILDIDAQTSMSAERLDEATFLEFVGFSFEDG